MVERNWLMTQDRVPAFSPSKSKNFIEKELGAPINVMFREFEDLPIAAASLGQVFTLCFSCFFLILNTSIMVQTFLFDFLIKKIEAFKHIYAY